MKNTAITLLSEHKYVALRALLENQNPTDLASLLSELPLNSIPIVFRVLPKELAAETFAEMESELQEHSVLAFSDSELRDVLSLMYVDDTVDMLEELPVNLVRRILRNTPAQKRAVINEILRYPENSVGSVMTVECVNLKKDMTVSQAFERIRRDGINKETIYTCYVTESGRVLIGIVSVKDLMLADPSDTVESLMETNIISCKTVDSAEDAAHKIEKYGLLALPVTDNEGRLVGIVTFDDAMDVIKEETDDEFMKMAAVSPLDDGYLKTSVWTHAKKRIVWLLVLMVSATFTGMIITEFENAMTALLVSFIPMLMDTGGNSGSQSTAIIIRGLATEEIRLRDYARVVFKELRIAILVGITLALANALRLWVLNLTYYRIADGMYREMVVVGIALIGAVVLAKVLGCTLPMVAKRLHLDPALVASPILTTLVDAGTVLLYFNVAMKFM